MFVLFRIDTSAFIAVVPILDFLVYEDKSAAQFDVWNITVLDPLVNGELAAIEQFADFLEIQVHGLSVV